MIYNNVRNDEIKLYCCKSYCQFTHHCSMHSLFSCPSHPNHRHEDVPLIKERGANPEAALFAANLLKFLRNIATTLTAIRVESVSPQHHERRAPFSQHCDDLYRNTRQARFRTPTLKRIFPVFNTKSCGLSSGMKLWLNYGRATDPIHVIVYAHCTRAFTSRRSLE